MQDLARVTGNPVVITIDGKDYILKALEIGRFGIVQNEILQCKRRAVLGVAEIECDGIFDDPPLPNGKPGATAAEKKAAVRAAAKLDARQVAYSSGDDLVQFIQSTEGLSFCIWLLFDQEYRGQFHRAQTLGMLPKIGAKMLEITKLILFSFGLVDELGNVIGLAAAEGAGPGETVKAAAGEANSDPNDPNSAIQKT